MIGWRTSVVVAVVAVLLFLTIQMAIPLVQLGESDRPQRFAWQMFSVFVEEPTFTVLWGTAVTEVDVDEYMARARGDIEITALLPRHLCDVVDGAEVITWEDEEIRC